MLKSVKWEKDCTKESFKFGALLSPEDSNDNIYEHVARGTMSRYECDVPISLDLRPNASPIRDQGIRGSCAAFTGASIKEIHEKTDNNFSGWMSPEFIYYHRENKPANGMYGRDVFQILQRIGSVPESEYPYLATDGSAPKPDKRLYEIAAQYKIANFAKVTTVAGLKRALVELGPCYLLLPLFATRPQFWKAQENEITSKSHAVTVVGYTNSGFILRNSWGETWNGDGHVEIPFIDWSLHYECWVSVDIADDEPKQTIKRQKKCIIL